MNFAHVHLLLNHIPVIAIPIGLLFLVHSLWKANTSAVRFSYLFLFLSSLTVIAVYLTGEPAEKMIEHLPAVTEAVISPHEDAALIAVITTLLMGCLSFVALILRGDEAKNKYIRNVVIVAALASTATLSYTALLGGKVRHTEIRDDFKVPSVNDKVKSVPQ
jgi:hypothetical protein